MRRILFLALPILALSACDDFQDKTARTAAKAVVNDVIESRAPGVNAQPITDCIIDNASANEIKTIAGDALTGVNNSTVALIYEIAVRPATVSCFVQKAGPLIAAEVVASK